MQSAKNSRAYRPPSWIFLFFGEEPLFSLTPFRLVAPAISNGVVRGRGKISRNIQLSVQLSFYRSTMIDCNIITVLVQLVYCVKSVVSFRCQIKLKPRADWSPLGV